MIPSRLLPLAEEQDGTGVSLLCYPSRQHKNLRSQYLQEELWRQFRQDVPLFVNEPNVCGAQSRRGEELPCRIWSREGVDRAERRCA